MTHTSPHTMYALDADMLRTVLTAAANFETGQPVNPVDNALVTALRENYAITRVHTFDPQDARNDDTLLPNLIHAAWQMGMLTGQAEPLLVVQEEADAFFYRTTLGEYPARVRLLTDTQAWLDVAQQGLVGADALVSAMENMVNALNAALSELLNYVTYKGRPVPQP